MQPDVDPNAKVRADFWTRHRNGEIADREQRAMRAMLAGETHRLAQLREHIAEIRNIMWSGHGTQPFIPPCPPYGPPPGSAVLEGSAQSPTSDGLGPTPPSEEEGGGLPNGDEKLVDYGEVGEPVPDPLKEVLANIAADEQFARDNPDLSARLRAPNPDDEARKAALMKRLIDLGSLQSLGALSKAGWAEFEQLTKYASWFK